MERHAQSIGIAVIVGLLFWGGRTLNRMYDAQIEQSGAISRQSLDINAVRAEMGDLKAEVKDVRQQLKQLPTQRELDARFETMSRRLDALEERQ